MSSSSSSVAASTTAGTAAAVATYGGAATTPEATPTHQVEGLPLPLLARTVGGRIASRIAAATAGDNRQLRTMP